MRIERALDARGWAVLYAECEGRPVAAMNVRRWDSGPARAHVQIDGILTPELMRAVGETFKQWAALAEEIGVTL